ncbi:hypothetical protein VB780_02010 [Leptolyngbya sp. CCNP1308]|uniref:hypothetical protein n=1 Tax=Leptolyngbya sp. CCNP1308 TaxID=3110255 RepID=UPI002B1EA1D7|nr:hypothetical protein [Leptolyngbya sp. CCNP1308]MEA5447325.1 hypothetical protein [Leptolyngbya sp. CCNP1308]
MPTTTRSKASSSEAEAALDAPAAAPEPEVDPSALFPAYIRKLRGIGAALEAIETARKEAKLPSLNPTDYRFILKRPGGIPFCFPVQVVYKPDSAKEKDLGTFRIGR